MQTAHIHIGVPSNGEWKARTGVSLCGLFAYFYCTPLKQFPGGQALSLGGAQGSILPQLRTNLVKRAQENGATYILFIDSDQTFPPNLLHRLIEWDVDIVACNVATKQLPSSPTARIIEDGKLVPIATKPKSTRLQQVDRIGTGIMLVKMSVFERLSQPWFQVTWNQETQDFEGEDWFFVRRLEEAGIPIYVDHGASVEVGHLGTFEYKHCHVKLDAEADKRSDEYVMGQPSTWGVSDVAAESAGVELT